jgi:hypothetical protein
VTSACADASRDAPYRRFRTAHTSSSRGGQHCAELRMKKKVRTSSSRNRDLTKNKLKKCKRLSLFFHEKSKSHQQYFWYIQHHIFMLNIFCLGVTDNTQHNRTQYCFKNTSKQDKCSPLIRLFNEMSMNTSQVSIQKRWGLKSHSTLRTKKRLVRLKSMSHRKVG